MLSEISSYTGQFIRLYMKAFKLLYQIQSFWRRSVNNSPTCRVYLN